MKNVEINGQTIKLTIAEERALSYLKSDGWVSPVDSFVEGPRKWQKYILPTGNRAKLLGVNQPLSPAGQGRVAAFFEKNPRRQRCATGNPRRINAILKQV
tara:strand:+ start:995 stop:1294 length:300 start_codon:yes stop_codon:yes gene_type:complete